MEFKSSPCPQHSLGFSFVSGREYCGPQKTQPLQCTFTRGLLSNMFSSSLFFHFPYYMSPVNFCVSGRNQVASEQFLSRDSSQSSLGQWALSWLQGMVQHRPECSCSAPGHSCRFLTELLHFQVDFSPSIFSLPPATLLPQLQMNVCVQLKEKHLSQLRKNKRCQPDTVLVRSSAEDKSCSKAASCRI